MSDLEPAADRAPIFRHLWLRETSGARKLAIAVTSALALLGGLFALSPLGGERFHLFLMLPIAGLALAGIAALLAPLGAQLFARAVQWSNLGLGFILTVLGSARERRGGVLLALGCGAALLAMGRQGLLEGERRAGFVPVAFRSSLLLLMVLALADAQSFGLFGAARLENGHPFSVFLVGAAALLTVGFVLLMRLSLAGLFVNAATTLAVALVSMAAWQEKLSGVTITLAVVHLLAAAPTLMALGRGKPVLGGALALGPRARAIGATSVVVGLMAVTTITWLVRKP